MYDYDNQFSYPEQDLKLKILTGIFFYFSIFVLTIMACNIFVAVIQDTFDKVQNQEMIASNYERAQLIHYYEKRMPQQAIRVLQQKGIFDKYLVIAKCVYEDQYNQIDGTMRNKLNKIEKQLNKQGTQFGLIEKIQDQIDKVEKLQQQIYIIQNIENKHQINYNFMERNLEKNSEIVHQINKQIENIDLLQINQLKISNKINKIKKIIKK